jgi:hypothetical protein
VSDASDWLRIDRSEHRMEGAMPVRPGVAHGPSDRKYAHPLAADRRREVGLRTRSEEVTHCSAIELRPEGRRDSNPQPVSFQAKEPLPAQQADIELSRSTTAAEASDHHGS